MWNWCWGYLRLGSESTDYTIRSYPLLPILRRAARKYAPPLYPGKVSLDLEDGASVITDEVAAAGGGADPSNAVAFPGASVRVSVRGEPYIQDDLRVWALRGPARIFEKGLPAAMGERYHINPTLTFAQPIQPEGLDNKKKAVCAPWRGSVPPFLVGVSKGGNAPHLYTTLRSKV